MNGKTWKILKPLCICLYFWICHKVQNLSHTQPFPLLRMYCHNYYYYYQCIMFQQTNYYLRVLEFLLEFVHHQMHTPTPMSVRHKPQHGSQTNGIRQHIVPIGRHCSIMEDKKCQDLQLQLIASSQLAIVILVSYAYLGHKYVDL